MRILTLDGGGAKGFYTLGVLKEVEAMIGRPLYERFQLVFGTSTGAIIAALVALGRSVDEIHQLYKEHVPTIMRHRSRRAKTAALIATAQEVFGDADFTQTKTDLGIVAARWQFETPMIFKSAERLGHGRLATFVPGFGCSIAQAVRASCSAYPFFERATVVTSNGESVELIDGGYCANNPTLYAIADATQALQKDRAALGVLSIGVGTYPEPKRGLIDSWKYKFWLVQLQQKTMDINTKSMDRLREILFGEILTIRISETYSEPEMATDLMEYDLDKLDMLFQRGRDSFGAKEKELRNFFA